MEACSFRMKLQWAVTNTLGRLERDLARPPGNQSRSGRKNQDSAGRCRQTSRQDGGEVGKEGERKKKKQGDKDTEGCSEKKKKKQKCCLEWQRPQRELHTHRTLPGTGAWAPSHEDKGLSQEIEKYDPIWVNRLLS